MTSQLLRTRPWTTPAMLAVFSDERAVAHALAFETALARAQAEAGLLDAAIADRIGEATASLQLNPAELADEVAHAGTLAIALVSRLRAVLAGDAAAAAAVHLGATSQDLADTMLMLQAREAAKHIESDLARICTALARLAEEHAGTSALGRTLLQDALPITFGLRAAQWLSAISQARTGLRQACDTATQLQFGGAVGTRRGLEGKGQQVAEKLAETLGLRSPAAPWHTDRTAVAALAAALGIAIGALGKIARDVSLLSQSGIDEAREPLMPGRGGSSAMPHKRNPTGCQVALSAAARAPGLVAAILSAMPQELERGLGGWQAEGPALADLFMLAGGSADAMAQVLEGLEVNTGALARNLAQAAVGTDTGEAEAIVAAILARYREGL